MIYFLLLVFGLILLVQSWLIVGILRTQRALKQSVVRLSRRKSSKHPRSITRGTPSYPVNHPKVQTERGRKR